MDLENCIYRLLTGDAGVAALIGDRLTAGVLPNPVVYPAMVYQPGGRSIEEVLDGGLRLVRERFAVKSVNKDLGVTGFSETSAIDQAAYRALHEYHGVVTGEGSPPELMAIQRIRATEGAHDYLWEAETQTHNFLTEFEAVYLDEPADP